jgi:hypothetical protein
VDVIVDFLGSTPFYGVASLLLFTLGLVWYFERQRTKEIIQENEAGLYCSHGRSRLKLCRDCAASWAAANEPAPAGDPFPDDPPAPATDPARDPDPEDSPLPDPPALRRPLRIDFPYLSNVTIELEVSTNARWAGAAGRCCVLTELGGGVERAIEAPLQLPAAVANWRLPLSPYHGPNIKAIVIPDYEGIDRIRVIANGQTIIDASPISLLALQELKR